MVKRMVKKWIVLPAVVGALLSAGTYGGATAVNPYTNPEIRSFSGAEEAAYIAAKTDQIFAATSAPGFTPSAAPSPADYEVPNGWRQEMLTLNGVPVERYTANVRENDRVVFFIHGGGYVGGLHNRYRDWGIHQGEIARSGEVLELDYRIAPAYRYPAALEDAVAAYKGLLAAGYDPARMILVGDSAGGNLASALAVYLRDHAIPLPQSIVLISPWTYVGTGLPSHTVNYTKDQILGVKNKRLAPEITDPSYARGADPTDPYLSTAYAELAGLPPMLITVGGDELLLDDAAIFWAHAKAAGVDAQLSVYPGMSHDWTILLPELPESAAMDAEIRAFIDAQMK